MGKVFAVGVGPGSPDYVTEIVKKSLLVQMLLLVMNIHLGPSLI